MEEENHFQRVIDEFDALTKNAKEVQRVTLEKILTENGNVEYLKKTGLDGRTDIDSFKACLPIITYEDVQPYIQRIIDGDTSPLLINKPITTFSVSSGTSGGKPKYIPFTEDYAEQIIQMLPVISAFMVREFGATEGKSLQFIYGSKQVQIREGLVAGTASTNIFSHPLIRNRMSAFQSQPSSPYEVIFGSNFDQSLYCHHLCGLISSDEIQSVSSTFAFNLVTAYKTLERIWEELVHDIREGVVSPKITDPTTRAAVSKILKPYPELADSIYEKCSKLSKCNWYGVIPALFPNAKYLSAVMTGSMKQYLSKLKDYAGDLPLVSGYYGSSEGSIGINLDPKLPPESTSFCIYPNFAYYEFLPTRKDVKETQEAVGDACARELELVDLTDVKVGEEYEIIMTTFLGLYRYKLGDVLKAVGFHNSTPKFEFLCRANVFLSIAEDKTSEKDLLMAIEKASRFLLANSSSELIDFTSQVDRSSEPGHYVIYWEIQGQASDEILQQCANILDASFVEPGYVNARRGGGINALELRIVGRGVFQKVFEQRLQMGTSIAQFKMPRTIPASDHKVLDILSGNVVKGYFSTVY